MFLHHWPSPWRPLWDCWACRGAALPRSSAAAPRPDTACPGTEHIIGWGYHFRYYLHYLLKFDVDHGYSKQFGNIWEKLQQQHVLYIKHYSEIKACKSDLWILNSKLTPQPSRMMTWSQWSSQCWDRSPRQRCSWGNTSWWSPEPPHTPCPPPSEGSQSAEKR